MHTMEIDSMNSQETPKSSNQTVVASWTMDAGVSELSDDIFSQLQKKQLEEVKIRQEQLRRFL